jgi:hypothetical protein
MLALRAPQSRGQHLSLCAFHHLSNLIRNEAVRLTMHRLSSRFVRGLYQAKHLASTFIEPV